MRMVVVLGQVVRVRTVELALWEREREWERWSGESARLEWPSRKLR